MTNDTPNPTCSTCGATKPDENEYCSNGFHYAPDTNPTLVKEAVEHSRSELTYYNGQGVPLENISVSLRGDLLEALLASLPTDDDDTVERVARAMLTAHHDGHDWNDVDPRIWAYWLKLARAAIHTLIGRKP